MFVKEKTQLINDRAFKWIGIPFTGILAFHTAGFAEIDGGDIPTWIMDYSFFTLISFSLWNGSYMIQYFAKSKVSKIKQLYIRIPVRYVITVIATWIISYIFLTAWNEYFQHNRYAYSRIMVCQIIMSIISIQISSIYEIVYLTKGRESDLVKVERSEKLKVQAQLDALKSQIDPHFIFNSLNTLSYLIGHDQQSAQLFNDTLAKVYRYILLNKEKDLIFLKEEIEFASNYFYLLKIRYQKGLSMVIKMDNTDFETYLIPPLSLQTLIENVIKHNHFSEKQPLGIEVTISPDRISVVNQKNVKKFDTHSSRIGLSNLNDRYSFILNRSITIQQTPDLFTVILPIIKS